MRTVVTDCFWRSNINFSKRKIRLANSSTWHFNDLSRICWRKKAKSSAVCLRLHASKELTCIYLLCKSRLWIFCDMRSVKPNASNICTLDVQCIRIYWSAINSCIVRTINHNASQVSKHFWHIKATDNDNHHAHTVHDLSRLTLQLNNAKRFFICHRNL